MTSVYLIGSLRNPEVPKFAEELRKEGFDVFDDWYAAGPEADDYWRSYELGRGHNFEEALRGYAAQHVFSYDKQHLDRCDVAVLMLPAGRSGHLEFGYMVGRGKPGYILLAEKPEDERFDVMYNFATAVFRDKQALFKALPNDTMRGWREDMEIRGDNVRIGNKMVTR